MYNTLYFNRYRTCTVTCGNKTDSIVNLLALIVLHDTKFYQLIEYVIFITLVREFCYNYNIYAVYVVITIVYD